MKLPNAENAYIQPAKILAYLLADHHPKGGGKAGFLVRFGFSREQWQTLEQALLTHGAIHPVAAADDTQYGPVFIIDGILETPDGRNPCMRTVWMIDIGNDAPRFVTAYPLGR